MPALNTPPPLPPLPASAPPIPEVPAPAPIGSIPMGEGSLAPEMVLDLPIAAGPYGPTWAAIEAAYPGPPAWLREAKFGIWVHFGPQAVGSCGDWYARRAYVPGLPAHEVHQARYGHVSTVGYKEVLRDWDPVHLDPAALAELYRDAGARFLLVQAVHHDNFDLWDCRYQPWNSTRMGSGRDFLGEWSRAARGAGLRYGFTFHHEYTWWWWQTAFGCDASGPHAGVPYDGHLTLADGVGQWWEGFDPRLLYGIDLREYEGVLQAAATLWRPPAAGLFSRHLEYARWYATWWSLRMMDAIDRYDPDFIYTDGTGSQPFSGDHTGTGIKADAMPRVIAHFYNRMLRRRGIVDGFSIVKFRGPTNGTVNTEEFGIPERIKTDQPWIAEAPVGDWFHGPGYTYSATAVVRYLIEAVCRDGNAAVCISPRSDGSLDAGCVRMLQEIGGWMRVNGAAIHGSRAWIVPGEGPADGQGSLRRLPGGKLGRAQAEYPFDHRDFRFVVAQDGALHAFCLGMPAAGMELRIQMLGTAASPLGGPIAGVRLLGHDGPLVWRQEPDALVVICPDRDGSPAIALVFRIEV